MFLRKTIFNFLAQSVRYATSTEHFRTMWSYRQRWTRLLQDGQTSMNNELAWVTLEAVDYLDQFLQPDHRVFEYGGGGSTLFFLNRVKMVATVENSPEWLKKLEEGVAAKKYLAQWDIFAVEGVRQPNNAPKNPADPADFGTRNKGEEDVSYEQYAKVIHRYPEAFFDVVLVDGRSRPACLKESLPHIRSGGWLVVDNMERSYYRAALRDDFYRDFEPVLDRYSPTPFHPDFTITAIFRKK